MPRQTDTSLKRWQERYDSPDSRTRHERKNDKLTMKHGRRRNAQGFWWHDEAWKNRPSRTLRHTTFEWGSHAAWWYWWKIGQPVSEVLHSKHPAARTPDYGLLSTNALNLSTLTSRKKGCQILLSCTNGHENWAPQPIVSGEIRWCSTVSKMQMHLWIP